MIKAGGNLSGLEACPQCNVSNPNLAYRSHFYHPHANSTEYLAWIVYQCQTCFDLVAVKTIVSKARMDNGAIAYLIGDPRPTAIIVPTSKSVDGDLPDRPRRYLEQAYRSLNAPDGAIMLAGSAIDAMLKIKGYTEGSVYSRIEKAVEEHVLTAGMRDWAHAVRLESNKPRHADLDEPHGTKTLAEQTIKFAESLGEYLFSLPARIERGRAASAVAIESDEGTASAG
jgi:hypothetical protein